MSASTSSGNMEHVMYKNRLQEYTQKSAIALPVYQTINEGSFSHAPIFRSTVYVDGSHYESPNTFPNRKEAEQDAARVALDNISQKPKPKEEACAFLPQLLQDTSLSKSIMNEYAVKMNLDRPTYVTKYAEGLHPVFISDLVLNGVSYTGQRAKSKKEAEQLAAHAAILSIMDSESKTTISKIMKSKEKLYALLHRVDVNQNSVGDNMADSGGIHSSLELSLSKRKENWAPKDMTNVNSFNLESSAPAQPFHEFKKPKVDSSPEVIPYPFVFIPPDSSTNLGSVPCSSSGKKKNHKKKSRIVVEGDDKVTDSVMLLGQVPQCSVAGESVSGDKLNVVVEVEGVAEEVVEGERHDNI